MDTQTKQRLRARQDVIRSRDPLVRESRDRRDAIIARLEQCMSHVEALLWEQRPVPALGWRRPIEAMKDGDWEAIDGHVKATEETRRLDLERVR